MVIFNQDKDALFTLTADEGQIWLDEKRTEDKKNIFLGWNIYGRKDSSETFLLGTYDEEADAQQIVNEIHTLLNSGAKNYSMPEPAMDLDDLEAM